MFTKSKKFNPNYSAQIVELTTFTPHPNADKMKLAHIGGYCICVGINDAVGKYIYFPTNCEINPNILSALSLYRHAEKNSNVEKTGFFNDNGRVVAIKLRGIPSEGFLLPISGFIEFLQKEFNIILDESEFVPGTDFDTFEFNGKSFWVNKKYVIQHQHSGKEPSNKRNNKLKYFDKVDDTQFSFHYDTISVKKQPWCVNPDDIISITSKWHGTSHISAYVACFKPMNIFRKLANILMGVNWNYPHRTYDYIYSSRSVIKNRYNKKSGPGFYGTDVWQHAHKVIEPFLVKGMTVYAEIVGFTQDGKYIQKGYDYGCDCPKPEEIYTYNKHFKIRVYRITMTNIDGVKHEPIDRNFGKEWQKIQVFTWKRILQIVIIRFHTRELLLKLKILFQELGN